jgi:hypothetical protein
MKLSTNLGVQPIKSLAKRSQIIVKLYNWLRFLITINFKDFVHIRKNMPKIKLIFKVRPYTMLSYPRLAMLYNLASNLEANETNGSFVECGVWNGGSGGIIAEMAKHNKNRHIWFFDSWGGLPEPSEKDISYNLESGEKGMALGFEQKVRELIFGKLNLDSKRIHLVRGWFVDTLPVHKENLGTVALLHLDCDWYESVKLCLEQFYDSVVRGGYIVIDDYGYWGGCREAVNEFIGRRGLKVKLIKIDYTGVYFQKEG